MAVRPTTAFRLPPEGPCPGARIAEKVVHSFHTCPILEIARLGRTLRRWRPAFLAYFTTARANNGGTDAVNGIIEFRLRPHPPHDPHRISEEPDEGDRPSRKRAAVHLQEMKAAPLGINSPPVEVKLESGVDLLAETAGQHRVAYVGLFGIS